MMSGSGRLLFAATVMLAGALAASPAVPAAALDIRCVNAASGASWTVSVDDQKRTVDGAPATITADRINWRDPSSGGLYDLDRKSGALTFTNPSSTGGYMLFHRCEAK
jgi:hypothetical protein